MYSQNQAQKDSIIKNRRNYVTETIGKEIEEK